MSVFERVKVGKGQRLSWGYTLAQAVDGNVVHCEQTRECAKPRCESCGSLRTQRSRERHAEECAPPAQERLVDGAWGGGGRLFYEERGLYRTYGATRPAGQWGSV